MIKKVSTVIELKVWNHPGVLSQVAGLFSRRAFNLEGILCGQIEDGSKSLIFLLVDKNEQLEQIEKQLRKLYDVLEIREREDIDHTLFNRLQEIISPNTDKKC